MNIRILLLLTLLPFQSGYGIALYGSEFNARISCANPLILNESLLISLDEDVVLSQQCAIIAGPNVNSESSITLTSHSGHSFRIACTLDGSALLPLKKIYVTGNAILIMGSAILANTDIECYEQSGIIIEA